VPNLMSAEKRMKQNVKSRERNRSRKSVVKAETKRLLQQIHDGQWDKATQQFSTVTKALDQVAAKGTFHKKTAARKKSRLAKRLNAARAAKPG